MTKTECWFIKKKWSRKDLSPIKRVNITGFKKKWMKDQIEKQNRDLACPEMCPVEIVIDIIEMSIQLGVNNATDPLRI